ncbi:MAG: succinylglutamate desuccinylase/aspartoacylase family protein [Pseudomonadota bacterium]
MQKAIARGKAVARVGVGSAIAARGKKAEGWLRIGELPDGRPMETPVVAINGAKPGPTLWIEACIHGDEYAGCFILHEFLRSVDPKKLAGALVLLPALNITAFNAAQRTSPFEIHGTGDLNRGFPGDPAGVPTEQMGHAIFREMTRVADYVIDFHTGGTYETRWALFAKVPGKVGVKSEAMARAFGFDPLLPTPPTTLRSSAFINAAKKGIPAMIVESGGFGSAFDEKLVADGAERLGNVARHLKMLAGAVQDYGKLRYLTDFAWINAPTGGLYRPTVRGGETIRRGEVIGRYFDLYGDPIGEVKSPQDGIVLTANPGPMMTNGDTLIQIGLHPAETSR